MIGNIRYLMQRSEKTIMVNLILIFLLVSCVSHDIKPTKDERVILEHALDQMSEEYSNPRLVSGKLIVKVSDIELLSSETLHLHNLSHGIPGSTDPFLGIWSSDIRDYPTQKVLDSKQVFPSPTSIDSSGDDNNNTILYWNVLEEMGNSSSFEISRSFRYLTYDYRPKPDSKMEQQQWHTIPAHIINRYTRSEMFLEQDEALVDTVFSLLETACGPVEQARIIYDWVQSSLSYIYPPEVRGVRNAFETREGDCGQYSALFITMARIAGIPARQQSGFNFFPGKTGAHVWSEIYLPVKGWVPIDATRDDGFLHLDNQRIITSIGLNIPLEHTPDWASFSNSEVDAGRTDFKQMYTLVSSGVNANYSSERTVIRSVEL